MCYTVDTFEVASPSGQARVYLHPVDRPRAGLVLGHGAGGGVTAPDLVAVREAALAEESLWHWWSSRTVSPGDARLPRRISWTQRGPPWWPG